MMVFLQGSAGSPLILGLVTYSGCVWFHGFCFFLDGLADCEQVGSYRWE